jgi:hypothetical protein
MKNRSVRKMKETEFNVKLLSVQENSIPQLFRTKNQIKTFSRKQPKPTLLVRKSPPL